MGNFRERLVWRKGRAIAVLVAVTCLAVTLVAVPGAGGAAGASSEMTLEGVTVDYPPSHFAPTWTYSTPDPGGSASWDTSTYTGTYSFPLPHTIPAGGVKITLSVTASTKSSAPHNTSFSAAEGISGALVPGGNAAAKATACGNCDPPTRPQAA